MSGDCCQNVSKQEAKHENPELYDIIQNTDKVYEDIVGWGRQGGVVLNVGENAIPWYSDGEWKNRIVLPQGILVSYCKKLHPPCPGPILRYPIINDFPLLPDHLEQFKKTDCRIKIKQNVLV